MWTESVFIDCFFVCTVTTVQSSLQKLVTASCYRQYIRLCFSYSVQGDHHVYLHCYPQQRRHTHSNFHSLYCPGTVKVMGMGIDFFVAGLNLNIITLIKSDEVHKLPELNDLIASFFFFLLCSLPCDLNFEGWRQ